MSRRRPHREHHHEDNFPKGHEPHIVDMGLLKITLSETADGWQSSAMNVLVQSEKLSLLEPDLTALNKEPSAADKLIVMVKNALREEGLEMVEERGNQPPAEGVEKNAKLASLMDFAAYNPEGSGTLIRAEKGYYQGTFNAHEMVLLTHAALDKIAGKLKGLVTAKAVEEKIDALYKSEEFGARPSDVMADKPDEKPAAQPDERQLFSEAVTQALPEGACAAAQREKCITAVVESVLSVMSSQGWSPSPKNVRGTKDDPMQAQIEKDLRSLGVGSTQVVKAFFRDEICDAVYRVIDQQRGTER